jgi:hypothetical protein
MKKCYKCKSSYEESFFYKDSSKKDGLSSRCKDCDSKVAKEYRKNSNVANLACKRWIENNPHKKKEYNQKLHAKVKHFQNYYKLNNPCDCGESDIDCIDFHHVNQKELEKRVPAIHTFKKTIKEMGKCVTVCANCHRKIHAGKKQCDKKPPSEEYLWELVKNLFPEVIGTHKKFNIN